MNQFVEYQFSRVSIASEEKQTDEFEVCHSSKEIRDEARQDYILHTKDDYLMFTYGGVEQLAYLADQIQTIIQDREYELLEANATDELEDYRKNAKELLLLPLAKSIAGLRQECEDSLAHQEMEQMEFEVVDDLVKKLRAF